VITGYRALGISAVRWSGAALGRRWIGRGVVASLVAGMFVVIPMSPAAAKSAGAVAPVESVAAAAVGVKSAEPAVSDLQRWSAPTVVWPSGGSAVVDLPTDVSPSSRDSGVSALWGPSASTTVGGLPVTVAAVDVADGGDVLSGQALQDAADGSELLASVSVTSVDHAVVDAAGGAAGVRVARRRRHRRGDGGSDGRLWIVLACVRRRFRVAVAGVFGAGVCLDNAGGAGVRGADAVGGWQ